MSNINANRPFSNKFINKISDNKNINCLSFLLQQIQVKTLSHQKRNLLATKQDDFQLSLLLEERLF